MERISGARKTDPVKLTCLISSRINVPVQHQIKISRVLGEFG
jgi:hypothetical protein